MTAGCARGDAKAVRFMPYLYERRAGRSRGGRSSPPAEEFFAARFGRPAVMTPDGRTAIALILRELKLCPADEIYITTTFEKPNVSSCVTSTIFNVCKPSRVISARTKGIFVIHEFGVPHPRIACLRADARRRRIPLIEDCAHTLDSDLAGKPVGSVGDYAICSLSKIFPVERGGVLVGMQGGYRPGPFEAEAIAGARRALAGCIGRLAEYTDRKRQVFEALRSGFAALGLRPLYELTPAISPSLLFPLVTDRCDAVMESARRAGVDCGRWHGSDIVVFPGHQFLRDEDIGRIIACVRSVYRKGGRE